MTFADHKYKRTKNSILNRTDHISLSFSGKRAQSLFVFSFIAGVYQPFLGLDSASLCINVSTRVAISSIWRTGAL